MYELGLGVKKDEKEAVKWLRKSAEADYVPSQKELGSCYETGSGVEKDDAEAVKWFRKAAEQGVEQAEVALKRLDAE